MAGIFWIKGELPVTMATLERPRWAEVIRRSGAKID